MLFWTGFLCGGAAVGAVWFFMPMIKGWLKLRADKL